VVVMQVVGFGHQKNTNVMVLISQVVQFSYALIYHEKLIASLCLPSFSMFNNLDKEFHIFPSHKH
jgi:hypothetical protein